MTHMAKVTRSLNLTQQHHTVTSASCELVRFEMKTQSTGKQELQSQMTLQELYSTLAEQREVLSSLSQLSDQLHQEADQESQELLKGEITQADQRFNAVAEQIDARLSSLEAAVCGWQLCYKGVNDFYDWLKEAEKTLDKGREQLQEISESDVKAAQAFLDQVNGNGTILEDLEKAAMKLSQVESSTLVFCLATARRKWELLHSQTKTSTSALSTARGHQQRYQMLRKRIILWTEKNEKRCASPPAHCASPPAHCASPPAHCASPPAHCASPPAHCASPPAHCASPPAHCASPPAHCASPPAHCASHQEAVELCDFFQDLIRANEENRPIFDQMKSEAVHLPNHPSLVKDVEHLQSRWENLGQVLLTRLHHAQEMLGLWTFAAGELKNLQEKVETLQAEVASLPILDADDCQLFLGELHLIKVFEEKVLELRLQSSKVHNHLQELSPQAGTQGFQTLTAKQEVTCAILDDVASAIVARQSLLAAACPAIMQRILKDTEDRVKSMQQCILASSHGIDLQQLPDKITMLSSMLNNPRTPSSTEDIQQLLQLCRDKVQTAQYQKLLDRHDKLQDLLGARIQVCQQWQSIHDFQESIKPQILELQERLADSEVQDEELAKMSSEMETWHLALSEKKAEARMLEKMMSATQVFIKDRATEAPASILSELQKTEELYGTLEHLLLTKRSRP